MYFFHISLYVPNCDINAQWNMWSEVPSTWLWRSSFLSAHKPHPLCSCLRQHFQKSWEKSETFFVFFFIILLESWHIYSLINNCLHLINSTSFLFIYSFIDFYHSWAMASCAVSRWSWSTSIKDVTNVLAAETGESIKPPAWCVRVSGTTWLTAVILPESEMSSQYGESNS